MSARAPARPRKGSLVFHPVSPDLWRDLERLFGPRGACGGCWCMFWRATRPDFERLKGEGNRARLRASVDSGEAPGILAYEDEAPVGWCAVAPRSAYPRLERSRVLAPVDAAPVWSVVCFYVEKGRRRRGLTVDLLRAAAEFVGGRGGSVLEGYPIEPRGRALAPPFAYMGLASAFRRAGFREVARRSPTRPIMRLAIGREASPGGTAGITAPARGRAPRKGQAPR